MQAGHDGGRVDEADDDVANSQRYLEEEHEQAEDVVLKPDEDGANKENRDVGGQRDGQQRREEQVEHLGDHLVEALLEEAEDPHAHQDGDDVALVANPVDAVEAGNHVEGDHGSVGDGGAGAVGVDEVGADEQCTEGGAKVGVASKDRRGGEAQKDLEVGEGAGVDQRCDAPPHGCLVKREEPGTAVRNGGAHVGKRPHDAHEHTGCHDGGDDRHKDVREDLDGTLERVALVGGGLLGLCLGRCGDAGLLDELVEDLVDGAGSKDHLELARGLEVALGANDVVELGLVDLAVVRDDQAQAGCTVRRRDDVARAANRLQHLTRRLSIVQSHVVSLLHTAHMNMEPFS